VIDRMPASGPNPARSRFFLDVAAGMQFLALYYTLTKEEQDEIIDRMRAYSAPIHPDQQPPKEPK